MTFVMHAHLRRKLPILACAALAACAPEPYVPPPTAAVSATAVGAAPASASSSPGSAVPATLPNRPTADPGAPLQAALAGVAGAVGATPRSAARYALEGICEVKPRTLVQIKSQANGEVTAVNVEAGDTVRKGQVLIEVSPRALNEQMQRNRLSRERVLKRQELLKLQIATQQREAQVLEQLYSEAGNTQKKLAIRERETELESSHIELRELEIQQKSIERELRYTRIESPGAGIIVKRTVEPGQIVNAAGGSISGGDALLELADKSELQLDCAVHAEDADLINSRVPLVVLLSRAQGTRAPVVVQRIAPMIDSRGQVPQLRFTAKFAAAVPVEVLLGARYPLQQAK
jgi:RND family efflux transporter MFP subunit